MAAQCSMLSQRSLRSAQFTARPARVSVRRSTRAVKVQAKYGEQSRFFDLQDLENTTGSWDVYGDDDPKRYPSLQEEFFNRAGEPFTRREAVRVLTGIGGLAAFVAYGIKGAKDAGLPITTLPDPAKTENGKGGKRAKL